MEYNKKNELKIQTSRIKSFSYINMGLETRADGGVGEIGTPSSDAPHLKGEGLSNRPQTCRGASILCGPTCLKVERQIQRKEDNQPLQHL